MILTGIFTRSVSFLSASVGFCGFVITEVTKCGLPTSRTRCVDVLFENSRVGPMLREERYSDVRYSLSKGSLSIPSLRVRMRSSWSDPFLRSSKGVLKMSCIILVVHNGSARWTNGEDTRVVSATLNRVLQRR